MFRRAEALNGIVIYIIIYNYNLYNDKYLSNSRSCRASRRIRESGVTVDCRRSYISPQSEDSAMLHPAG